MKLLLINSVCGIGSTGRIAAKIATEYESKGWNVKFGYGRDPYVPEYCKKWAVRIGSSYSVKLYAIMTRLFDLHGTGPCSYFATKRFLRWAENWKPDVVWLHNLHGYYINYVLLFKWLKSHPGIQVRWTLHDSWAYTGHCAYFVMSNCSQWRTKCVRCPSKRDYPASVLFSRCLKNFMSKKKAFLGVKNMKLIIPSNWLANITRLGFLCEYPMEIVKNTIDLSVFKPTCGEFRKRMGLMDKVMILGVANAWDQRKGLDDFIALRKLLEAQYAIVVVGVTERQIAMLPDGIIGIARTSSPQELAEMYTAADWYFNPTHEDIFSMTNMEAAACGCKVVTYDTGGAPEAVEDYDKAWVLKGAEKSPEGFVKLLKSQENQ